VVGATAVVIIGVMIKYVHKAAADKVLGQAGLKEADEDAEFEDDEIELQMTQNPAHDLDAQAEEEDDE
jgi:hypothetical protein